MTTNQSTQAKPQVAPTELKPNPEFARLASDEVIARTAQALTANGFTAIVVDSGEQARQKVHELLTPGAEVFDATSRTLDTIGLTQEIHAGDIPYNAIKPQIYGMDRQTQMREIRKLAAAPDYVIGSVHALTEQGASVAVYERGVPGNGQSGGESRIFRHAHDDRRLVGQVPGPPPDRVG